MSCCTDHRPIGTRGLRALLALTLAAGLFAGCGRKNTDDGRTTVSLFFTSQTHGRLTHCGCFSGQYGGLARLRTAIAQATLSTAIGVDVGDAIEGPEDYHLLKYKQVVRAYSDMRYVALNAGQREASLPAKTLRELGATSPVPLLGANLIDRETGKPVLKPWTVVERDGVRLGFVGVVDPRGLQDTLGEGLAVEDVATCLGRVIPEAARVADVLVLLAYTDEETLGALARRFYEFSLVLGGKVSQPAQALRREGAVYVYYTGNEAKSFGALDLVVQENERSYVTRHAITLLDDRYVEHERVLALVAEYRREVGRTPLAIDSREHAMAGRVPGARASAEYVGSQSCVVCHPSAGKAWSESLHAHAFDVLVARGAEADPSCIGCHTVGFGSPSGYRREFGSTKLTHVGCESCHGPGSTHVAQRQSGGPVTAQFRPLGPGDCQKCHHGEFSRPFDWDAMWPRIRHGKEPKA